MSNTVSTSATQYIDYEANIIIRYTHTLGVDSNIVEKIKLLDVKSFDSSTRFLIYNIIDNK
jgi:hypothetical protein